MLPWKIQPILAFVVIYNSDHPLGAQIDMDVLDHDGLAVPPPAPYFDRCRSSASFSSMAFAKGLPVGPAG